MTTRTILSHENRAVVVDSHFIEETGDKYITAVCYVNTRGQIKDNILLGGDICSLRWSGKTMKGAEKFANKFFGI